MFLAAEKGKIAEFKNTSVSLRSVIMIVTRLIANQILQQSRTQIAHLTYKLAGAYPRWELAAVVVQAHIWKTRENER